MRYISRPGCHQYLIRRFVWKHRISPPALGGIIGVLWLPLGKEVKPLPLIGECYNCGVGSRLPSFCAARQPCSGSCPAYCSALVKSNSQKALCVLYFANDPDDLVGEQVDNLCSHGKRLKFIAIKGVKCSVTQRCSQGYSQ